jgi:hypothetical protein
MSRERELLKEFIDFVDSYEFYPTERNIIWEIVSRTQELLAQPEQEPVAWIIETEIYGKLSEWVCMDKKHYMEEHDSIKEPIPLYTAPPKREPITGIEISNGFKADDEATHPYSYWAGVDFAEKHHGIGGGE